MAGGYAAFGVPPALFLAETEADNIDSELEKIRSLGGETDEKMPVPSMGWFAHAKDPDGNEFSVWQADESAPMPEGMGAQTASS